MIIYHNGPQEITTLTLTLTSTPNRNQLLLYVVVHCGPSQAVNGHTVILYQ